VQHQRSQAADCAVTRRDEIHTKLIGLASQLKDNLVLDGLDGDLEDNANIAADMMALFRELNPKPPD
jgi:hypothetical protein